MTFLFSTVAMYYSCRLASEQTGFHVHGMQRASRLDRFVKFAFAQSFTGSVM